MHSLPTFVLWCEWSRGGKNYNVVCMHINVKGQDCECNWDCIIVLEIPCMHEIYKIFFPFMQASCFEGFVNDLFSFSNLSSKEFL